MRPNLALLTFSRVTIFCGLLLLLTACPSRKKEPSPKVQTFWVMGDPRKIYEGTRLEPDFDLKYFENAEFSLVSGNIWLETSEIQNDLTEDSVKNVNKTNKSDLDSREIVRLKTVVNWQEGIVDFISQDGRTEFSLRNETSGRQVAILVSNDTEKIQEVSLKHFSVSANGNGFSILFLNDSEAGNARVGYYLFARNFNKYADVRRTESNHPYVLGYGLKIKRDTRKPIQISVCDSAKAIEPTIRAAAEEWQKAFSAFDKKIRIRVSKASRKCAPISDLKEDGIHFIKGLKILASDRIAYQAETDLHPQFNPTKIESAGVLVFEEEFLKSRGRARANPRDQRDQQDQWPQRDKWAQRNEYQLSALVNYQELLGTIAHELGHFLGLGHRFDGSKSIMAYFEDSRPTPTKVDVDALKELYEE